MTRENAKNANAVKKLEQKKDMAFDHFYMQGNKS